MYYKGIIYFQQTQVNVFPLQMLGVKRTERVLPVGTPLTVVGEVS